MTRYAELRGLRPFYTAYNRMFRVSNTGYGDGGGLGIGYGYGCGYGKGGEGFGYGDGDGYGDGFGFGKSPGIGSIGGGRGDRPTHELRGVV